jgi:Flp pilus assembly protein TadD
MQSLKQDSTRFTVKNNLVLARAAQGKYTLPVINLTQIERAELLNTMGLSAVKKGDIQTAKSLFREAVETHPQYFESAHRSLEALENS